MVIPYNVRRCWRAPSGVYILNRGLTVDASSGCVVRERGTLSHARYIWSRGSYDRSVRTLGEWSRGAVPPSRSGSIFAAIQETFADDLPSVMQRCGVRPPRWRHEASPPHTRYLVHDGRLRRPWHRAMIWTALLDETLYTMRLLITRMSHGTDRYRLMLDTTRIVVHRDDDARRLRFDGERRHLDGTPEELFQRWEAFVVDPASFILTQLIL